MKHLPIVALVIVAVTVGVCYADEECDSYCTEMLGGGQKRGAHMKRLEDNPKCEAFCKSLESGGGGGSSGSSGVGNAGDECEELCEHWIGADQREKRDAVWDQIASDPACASWCLEMEAEEEKMKNTHYGGGGPAPKPTRSCDDLCDDYLGVGSKKEKRQDLWALMTQIPNCAEWCKEMEEEY